MSASGSQGSATVPGRAQWYFDVLSPYSYLHLHLLPQLPPGLQIDYVPVLLAALLNHHGQRGPAEIPAKRPILFRDMLWRAQRLGIPLKFPPRMPFNPLRAMRLLVALGPERAQVVTAFEAVFARGADLEDPDEWRFLCTALGVADAEALIESRDARQRLRSNTEAAIARGVFGVPTLAIGQQLFWGSDTLDMTLDFLRDPQIFATPEMQRAATLPVGVVRKPPG